MTETRTRALTMEEIERINAMTAQRVQRVSDKIAAALILAVDGEKKARLAHRHCTWCFYGQSGRLVGQAFTEWQCRLCAAKGMHHNTGVPAVCNDCSDAFHLCVECGADLALHRRTKFERKARRKKKA